MGQKENRDWEDNDEVFEVHACVFGLFQKSGFNSSQNKHDP